MALKKLQNNQYKMNGDFIQVLVKIVWIFYKKVGFNTEKCAECTRFQKNLNNFRPGSR